MAGRQSKERRRGGAARLTLAVVLVVGISGAAGFFLADTFLGTRDILQESEVLTEAFPDDVMRPAPCQTGSTTILLSGSDTHGDIDTLLESAEGDRSDLMLLMRISGDREHVAVMSVMRDLWVEIPGQGDNKINAALALGGVPLTVQTIEGLFGSRIDHVAIIDFEGFSAVTDVLDGVTVSNDRAFSPRGLPSVRFPAGEVTLSGEEALAY